MIRTSSSIESLEARIAPAALPIVNPLPDITAGLGKTGAEIELTAMFDADVINANHTIVTFKVNIDSDPDTAGIQPSTFVMELFDDEAPLTVQNFLAYLNNPDTARDFVNTFFHRSIAGFIVQGGGFDVSDPSKHIPVSPEVHNEFSPTRSNLAGTVAMAKTGLGPNTATSEWFVNLADNSANLDAQNGGFTVFGQITSGLELFTQIAALPKVNLGGGLTDVPVQKYNSDPDHNPNTPPPKPNANQLITITDFTVAKPSAGDATGYIFSAPPEGNSNPDLVTATVDANNKLQLTYAPGKTGVADITVHVKLGNDSVDQVVHVEVLPNLIANITKDPLPNIVVAGDIGTATVKLTNNGSGTYTGTGAVVKFYLSKVTDTDSAGTVVDINDILVGTSPGQNINLTGGASTTFTASITIPSQLFAVGGEAYHLIARVEPSVGSPTEQFTDDNTAVDGKVHAYVNKVGKVTIANAGTRVIPKLTFTDSDGDRVVVTLTGPGVADVQPVTNPDGNDFNLSVENTSILSKLTVGAKPPSDPLGMKNGRVGLHNIDITNAIGTVDLSNADVDGYTTFSGGVQNLSIGNLGDFSGSGSVSHTMILGALLPSNAPASIRLGKVNNYNLESDQRINLLTAVNWLDSGDEDHIIAPSLTILNIKGAPSVSGDLEADVFLEGRAKTNSFRVAGFFQDATFTALKSGGVDTVSVGGMQDAGFFVGTDARPSVVADFNKIRSIGTFTVTGAAKTAGNKSFINSQVAAANIGAIRVMNVDTASGTGDFGFVADTIGSYVRDGVNPILHLTKGKYDPVDHYSVTAVTILPLT